MPISTKKLVVLAVLCAFHSYPVHSASYEDNVSELAAFNVNNYGLLNEIDTFVNTDKSLKGSRSVDFKTDYTAFYPVGNPPTVTDTLTFNYDNESGKYVPVSNGTTGDGIITFNFQKEYGHKDVSDSTIKYVWNVNDNQRTLTENSATENPDIIYYTDNSRLSDGNRIITSGYGAYSDSSIDKDFIGGSYDDNLGGAIYHTKSGYRIESITGDFINNTNTSSNGIVGGLIYVQDSDDSGTSGIELIRGNFINNTADNLPYHAQGGVIGANSQSGIGKIEGNFIGNKISSTGYVDGGAIYNNQDKVIGIKNIDGTEVGATDAIIGNFIGNTAESYNETLGSVDANAFGGVISNHRGLINGNIKGSFVENGVKTANGAARGGVLYTEGDGFDVTNGEGRIYGNIEGDFIGNYAVSENCEAEGGAIYAQIATISGDIKNGSFIGNRAEGGTSAKAGAVYLSGGKNSVNNIESDFIRNQATATSGRADGGAVNSSSKIYGDLSSNFIENKAEGSTIAQAGALYSSKGVQGSVTGNYSGNSAIAHENYARGGAIYNSGTIGYKFDLDEGYEVTGKLQANFYNNTVKSDSKDAEGGAIYNSSSGTYGNPNGYISAIEGEFIGNSAQAGSSGSGGAIYNDSQIGNETGTTAAIIGNFSSNTVSGSTGADGGAIYNNGNIYGIKGTGTGFSDNSITCTGATTVYGGAIYNSGKIEGIEADFLKNSATSNGKNAYGGAIYSAITGTKGISYIKGNFTENKALAKVYGIGGAIAYYNSSGSNETSINESTFTNNLAQGETTAYGGVIYSQAKSSTSLKIDITGTTFDQNTAMAKTSMGGALYTDGNTIVLIDDSTFRNNSATFNEELTDASIASGGAIYNYGGNYIIKDTSFENNNATATTANGGAIYNRNNTSKTGTMSIIAQEKDVLFNGNTTKQSVDSDAVSNAIYNNGAILNLNAAADKKIEFNDSIVAASGSVLNINKEGEWNSDTDKVAADGSGIPLNAPVGGKIIFNGDMSQVEGNVNLHGGSVEFKENSEFFNLAQVAVEKETKLNLINNKTEEIKFSSLVLNDKLKVGIDANLQANESDKLSADNVESNVDKGIIITDLNIILNGDSTSINIADSSLKDHVTLAQTADLNIIGASESYLLSYNEENGNINFRSVNSLQGSMEIANDGDIYGMTKDEVINSALGSPNANPYGVNGGGYSIIGQDVSGFEVGADQSLGLTDIKSIEGFKAENGAAVKNDGTLNIKDTSFKNNTATNEGGAILNNGNLNIVADKGEVVFENNTDSSGKNAIANKGIVNLQALNSNIRFSDAIVGNGTDTSVVNIQDGNGAVEFDNTVSQTTVNQTGGMLRFLQNGGFSDTVAYAYNGGNVSLQNGSINNANLGNLTLNNDMNLSLDANFQTKQMDTITANSFNSNGNKINIMDIIVLEPTTDEKFSISPIGSALQDDTKQALASSIQYTGGDIVYSPIYKYNAEYDPNEAMLNFKMISSGGGNNPQYNDLNPGIMAAPVAAQLGGYLTQLNSYDEAFRNMDMYMLMTKSQRQTLKNMNKYADSNNSYLSYSPLNTPYSDKAGWFRPYASYEKVGLKNGPKVSNFAYGTFAGLDSGLHEFQSGWDGMFSVYAGYNGSHQAYQGNSIYQNGGTFGLAGMLYKNNFFTGLTANVGASVANSNTMFGDEDFAMLMTGVAWKTGYNIEMADGKFIIQPSYLMSYSLVDTFNYKNAANVRIKSNNLNAIQMEPGLKFILNLKNGVQPYAGVSVVWNLMDKTEFMANDVSLPNLSIKPFVKYGLGVRKIWGETTTGFAQTYLTGGGRNGVGFQAGCRIRVGKG